MTTAVFRYLDPASVESGGSGAWAKVDTDVSSYKRTERRRSVTDIRTSDLEFGTDISGFAVHHYPAKESAFTDDSAVRNGYYAEVEDLLRAKLPGIKKVFIFDHTIRRRDKSSPRQPVQQVHVDQTPWAAEVRVRRHLPEDEANELLKGRYQIINVWRPIENPATDFPLAVIDWRTTVPDDLVKVGLLYPKRVDPTDDDDRGKEVLPDPALAKSTEGYERKGETWSVKPNENHKFYYVKDMTPEEAMFIKCYDSRGQGQPNGKEGLAALTPHTAFEDPATPKDAKGRQSIEVRCLVFYE